jgi:3-oxoacyl-[acyl-carrier protein] reductase
MIDPGIEGRVALVTGTDSPRGIGAAIARSLAGQGVHVALAYRDDEPVELASECMAMGVQAVTLRVDLADPAAIEPLFDRAEAALGPVAILINNAAASDVDTFDPVVAGRSDLVGRTLHRFSAETHDFHFAVNSRATGLTMAELARRMHAHGAGWGRIVNISTGGARGFAGEVSYGASKWAMESMSRAAAAELGSLGITVNVVSPGPTQTGWIPDHLEGEWGQDTPLRRIGYPEDIADSVTFLCSQQGGWLTGQVLQAGGGHKM